MSLALKEAVRLQAQIEALEEEESKPSVPDSKLVETKATLEKAIECLRKDIAEVARQINEEAGVAYKTACQKGEKLSELRTVRDALLTAVKEPVL